MGFVSEVLKNVEGIQWYYIVGIFIIILYKTIKTPKADLIKYKTAILDEQDTQCPQNISNE